MRNVVIEETVQGWLVVDPGQIYSTAAEALAAVKADAEARVRQSGTLDIMRVEWAPTTRIGRMVVRAITSSRKGRRYACRHGKLA